MFEVILLTRYENPSTNGRTTVWKQKFPFAWLRLFERPLHSRYPLCFWAALIFFSSTTLYPLSPWWIICLFCPWEFWWHWICVEVDDGNGNKGTGRYEFSFCKLVVWYFSLPSNRSIEGDLPIINPFLSHTWT